MTKIKGKLIDCFYEDDILFITLKHKKKEVFPVSFSPYFYLVFNNQLDTEETEHIKKALSAKAVFLEKKHKQKQVYKVVFDKVSSLVSAKDILDEKRIINKDVSVYEYDIPFVQRFLLDKKLTNFVDVSVVIKDGYVVDIFSENRKPNLVSLEVGCFDIEVLVDEELNFPDPKKQPIISISYMDSEKNKSCFVYVKEDVKDVKKELEEKLNASMFVFYSEKEMLLGFINFLEKKDPDILYSYNGVFDLTYIAEAYKKHFDEELKIKNHSLTHLKYPRKRVSLKEIVHIDVYQLLKLLRYFQAINLAKLDLNSVYQAITNNQKISLGPKEMRDKYLNKQYIDIVRYNLDDVSATLDLAETYIDFIFGVCSFIDCPVDDVLFFSASAIVEKLFMGEYITHKKLIPNKPNKYQISERKKHTFTGAFVYQPEAGLYENIAVVDFRTYHVSLLIAYNISPETVNAKENFKEVNNVKVSQKEQGFVPALLENLIEYRVNLKRKMLNYDKKSQEYRAIYRQQFALKILIASTYGYMGFAGARWYCSECLDSMYFLVRTKIQEIIKTFEDKGFHVLYGDTDSCFVQFKDIKTLKEEISKINDNLPKNMFLELEDLFKTGLFVKARDATKTAKKKYALLDFNNELKIRGFEFVRRDWCRFVKDIQKKVLFLVLEKKDSKEAIVHVKKKIVELQEKKVPVKDLVIQSFVHKNLSAYKTKNPAQSAVISAKESGYTFSRSDVIEYVITEDGKTISEKAKIIDLVKEKSYDVSYYLEKQLIPAVFSILNVFDISKEELISNTKQKNLKDFFK